MKNWREVESKIKNSKHAVILSHRSPDGDSVGSSLALYHFLKNYISHVQVITPDPAPKFLSWLNGFDAIANYQENETLVNQELQKADLICCLRTRRRIGNRGIARRTLRPRPPRREPRPVALAYIQ